MTIQDYLKAYYWQYVRPNFAPSSPAYKQQEIIRLAQQAHINTFIETGTYQGDTTAICASHFAQLTTIELSKELHAAAVKRFADQPHIKVLQGDSASVIAETLTTLNEPALFWLDAHYSMGLTAKAEKNTPIVEEVISILSHKVKNHIILIDDARCFHPKYPDQFIGEAANSLRGYPTLTELIQLVKQYGNYRCYIVNDIIRIHL